MTKLANIQLPDNRILDPMLDELVRKLALDNPQWVFSWKKPSEWNYHHPIDQKRDANGDLMNGPPEGMQYLRRVRVLEAGEQLGTVSVSYKYGRSTRATYDIESWRIEKQRGARNTTSTEKLDIAIRKIKKLFAKMNHGEVLDKADDTIRNSIYHVLRDLASPISRLNMIKDEVALQKYVFCTVRGLPIPAPIKTYVEELFGSEKYEEQLAKYELSKETELLFTKGLMTSVVAHNGHYLYKENDEIKAVGFDDIPEAWQNRIAVLQLMQDGEVVRDVGYRYNDTHFYIVI